jgi:hypothetical protein
LQKWQNFCYLGYLLNTQYLTREFPTSRAELPLQCEEHQMKHIRKVSLAFFLTLMLTISANAGQTQGPGFTDPPPPPPQILATTDDGQTQGPGAPPPANEPILELIFDLVTSLLPFI